ncbi:hypothetical protein AYK21_05450 [Thermoplasmatales archaeon SG8-52-2]|nr:MAG: hypothetical protein AYK21_05450 [Thermoplasmatales archaeon SG8-52-2]
MKRKINSVLLGIGIIVFLGQIASAASIQDNLDDVAHWSGTMGGTWGWTDINVEDRPNIDIKELKQSVNGDKMMLELIVDGTIQSTQLHYYWVTFNTTDSYYFFSWSNGTGFGWAANTITAQFDMDPEVSASGNTITAIFDIIDEDTSADEFWAYAWEYSTFGDIITAEWWGDWAPDTYNLFDIEDVIDDDDDEIPGGEGSGDENGGENDDNNEGSSNNKSTGTPGFELLTLIAAFLIIIVISKKR